MEDLFQVRKFDRPLNKCLTVHCYSQIDGHHFFHENIRYTVNLSCP